MITSERVSMKNSNRQKWRVVVIILLVLIVIAGLVLAALALVRSPEQLPSSTSVPSQSQLETGVSSSTSPDNEQTDMQFSETTIGLTYAPVAATIILDGKEIHPDNQFWSLIEVDPGVHTISIQMEGFSTFSKTFTLNDGDNFPILVALKSNQESTKNYYDMHSDDQQILEGITEPAIELFSVADLFPISGRGFEVSIAQSSDKSEYWIAVTCHLDIISYDECRLAARTAIESDPVSLNPYSYIFKYTNK